MNVLIDTNVWSSVFRRRAQTQENVTSLLIHQLIAQKQARMIGVVRQELLSGVKTENQFEALKTALRSFPNEPLTIHDYEYAAFLTNFCQSHGVTAHSNDFLLCAAAINRGWKVYSFDNDFKNISKWVPSLQLLE